MNSKGSPPNDAKTIPVGTVQKGGRPKAEGGAKFVTETQGGWSDDGKTAYVQLDEESLSGVHNAQPPSQQGQIRSGPSARLPWPARDQRVGTGPNVKEDSSMLQDGGYQGSEEPPTELFTPGAVSSAQNKVGSGTQEEGSSPMREDPVVGWLVIVDGPGKGNSIEIGIGANPIGRDRNQKICLDYGDQQIHREKHAVLIYDPRSRRFYLQSGDVRNLTYLGDQLVLTPAELKGGEVIVLGQTQLRFVPFCGPDFGWL